MSGQAIPVLNDPQFGLTVILRPYPTYTTRYNAQPVSSPIMMTEGGVPFDPRAGQPGYNQFLLKGQAVPFGARVSIWLPIISSIGVGIGDVVAYEWLIGWRQRNVFDYRIGRLPFHFPRQAPMPNNELLIPMAVHGSVMTYSEPVTGQAIDNVTLYPVLQSSDVVGERFRITDGSAAAVFPTTPIAPIVGSGTSLYAQQLQGGVNRLLPSYVVHDLQAQGDELLIGLTRPSGDGAGVIWNFATSDLGVLRFFEGSPDIGVLVNIGVAT